MMRANVDVELGASGPAVDVTAAVSGLGVGVAVGGRAGDGGHGRAGRRRSTGVGCAVRCGVVDVAVGG